MTTQVEKPEPVVREVSVSWKPEEAYRRFVNEFSKWWPVKTHSIGGPRIKRVVFEAKVGGRIYEEHIDGRRFQWGKVLELDPPRRARRGYQIGWGLVLDLWAGRMTMRMRLINAIGKVVLVMQLIWHGGRVGLIDSAEGEL